MAAANAVFPAADPVCAAVPVDELLASVEDLVARIRLCFGLSREDFENEIEPLLRRHAAYVHLLPATADNYFSAPGGLLKLGLEVAFFALQGTDAHIFSGRSTITARRQLEPRWRLATFVGGLCCELHRVLGHVVVTDAHGGDWPAYLMSLTEWLSSRGAGRYFVRWRPNAVEARALGLFALPLVVPPRILQFLAEGNTIIVPQLLASVGGVPLYRDHNVLDSLVRRSLALVIDRSLQADVDRHGAPQTGSHLSGYLVDAMQRLAAGNSSWAPNGERSRVWFGPEGLFLVWPQSATDVQALLEADHLPGIPKEPETVLELLLAAGVLERQDEERTTWTILPPHAKAPVEAVKLASPALLLSGLHPPPQALPGSLLCSPGASAQPSPPPPVSAAASRGAQLSLIEPTPPDTNVPAPPPAPLPSLFSLDAPLRLSSSVRDALVDIVQTLNGPGRAAAACTVSTGLFVPLREFERRGIQPAMAARALADSRMLVQPGGGRPLTTSHDFGGQPTPGLIVAPQFVAGFDPAAFVRSESAEP